MNEIKFNFVLRVHKESDVQKSFDFLTDDDIEQGAAHPFFANFKQRMKDETQPDRVVLALPVVEEGSLVLSASVTLFYVAPSAFAFAISVIQGTDWLSAHLYATAKQTFGDRITVSENKVRNFHLHPDAKWLFDQENPRKLLSEDVVKETEKTRDPRVLTHRVLIFLLLGLWAVVASWVLTTSSGEQSKCECCGIAQAENSPPPSIVKQVCTLNEYSDDGGVSSKEPKVRVYK